MENLSDIAVFVQVVENKSFTATAERLELSKSVVSKYVSRLEQRLGVRLLNRSTRKLSLTEAGNIMYQRCLRGLDEIEAAEIEVSHLQQTPKGQLKFNVPMSFGIQHIAPAIPAFQREYPEVQINMNLDDRRVDLVEEGYDLAIRIGELPDSNLVARRLGPCRHVLCASPAYLKEYGIPRTPQDLEGHRTLSFAYHDAPNEWKLLSASNQYVTVPIKNSISMNNSIGLLQALLQGAGIALVPTFIAGTDLQAGRLKKLLPSYGLLEVSIYAVYPQRKYLSPKVRAFIDFISKRITDKPYWDK